MGEIARFFGIVVRMYSETGGRHHRPHLHAYAEGMEIVVALDSVEVMNGELSRRNERLLLAWVELHLEDLRWNWAALNQGEPPRKIDPLR